MEGILERWHVGGGSCGETMSHCLGRRMEQRKNNKNKIHGDLNWPHIGKSTHNNQPKEAQFAIEESMERVCDRG